MSTATVNNITRTIAVSSTGSPGRPGIVWVDGGWQSETAYGLHVGLQHGGSSYRSIAAHTSTAETEPGTGVDWETVWEMLAQKGDTGPAAPWVQMTQAEYDQITPDPDVLYVVIG